MPQGGYHLPGISGSPQLLTGLSEAEVVATATTAAAGRLGSKKGAKAHFRPEDESWGASMSMGSQYSHAT